MLAQLIMNFYKIKHFIYQLIYNIPKKYRIICVIMIWLLLFLCVCIIEYKIIRFCMILLIIWISYIFYKQASPLDVIYKKITEEWYNKKTYNYKASSIEPYHNKYIQLKEKKKKNKYIFLILSIAIILINFLIIYFWSKSNNLIELINVEDIKPLELDINKENVEDIKPLELDINKENVEDIKVNLVRLETPSEIRARKLRYLELLQKEVKMRQEFPGFNLFTVSYLRTKLNILLERDWNYTKKDTQLTYDDVFVIIRLLVKCSIKQFKKKIIEGFK